MFEERTTETLFRSDRNALRLHKYCYTQANETQLTATENNGVDSLNGQEAQLSLMDRASALSVEIW